MFYCNFRRACELYAQIVGARVDYGIARSQKYGHDRFGEDYTGKGYLPEFENDPNVRIHLIAHSLGGSTGRMFISLMRYVSFNMMMIKIVDICPKYEL